MKIQKQNTLKKFKKTKRMVEKTMKGKKEGKKRQSRAILSKKRQTILSVSRIKQPRKIQKPINCHRKKRCLVEGSF